jgi:hypothetical protein
MGRQEESNEVIIGNFIGIGGLSHWIDLGVLLESGPVFRCTSEKSSIIVCINPALWQSLLRIEVTKNHQYISIFGGGLVGNSKM